MALDPSLLTGAGPVGNQFGLGWFVPHKRMIAGITADVTVEESERDEVTVTEHPVEQGAPISDHAFKRPEEVIIRAGWSFQKTGDLSAETGIYGILLNWQATFLLFDLYTGKRRHKNMLISSLWVETDQHSEYTLMVAMTCRQVILTNTQTAQTGISNNPANHLLSSSTTPSVEGGASSANVNPEGSNTAANALANDATAQSLMDRGIVPTI